MYDHRKYYRISKMAEVLDASRTGYYAWVQRGCSSRMRQRDVKDLFLIRKTFVETRETYGTGRLSKHFKQKGHMTGRIRVDLLMRENNIVPKTVKKFKATTNSNHDYPVTSNLLNRNFTVSCPNTAWVCYIPNLGTDEGWLYLAAVMELCTEKK